MEISDVLEDGERIVELRDMAISMINHIKSYWEEEFSSDMLKQNITTLLQLKEKYEKISNRPKISIGIVKSYGICTLGEETFKKAVTDEIYNKL